MLNTNSNTENPKIHHDSIFQQSQNSLNINSSHKYMSNLKGLTKSPDNYTSIVMKNQEINKPVDDSQRGKSQENLIQNRSLELNNLFKTNLESGRASIKIKDSNGNKFDPYKKMMKNLEQSDHHQLKFT